MSDFSEWTLQHFFIVPVFGLTTLAQENVLSFG